jgi:hypothetical protein
MNLLRLASLVFVVSNLAQSHSAQAEFSFAYDLASNRALWAALNIPVVETTREPMVRLQTKTGEAVRCSVQASFFPNNPECAVLTRAILTADGKSITADSTEADYESIGIPAVRTERTSDVVEFAKAITPRLTFTKTGFAGNVEGVYFWFYRVQYQITDVQDQRGDF